MPYYQSWGRYGKNNDWGNNWSNNWSYNWGNKWWKEESDEHNEDRQKDDTLDLKKEIERNKKAMKALKEGKTFEDLKKQTMEIEEKLKEETPVEDQLIHAIEELEEAKIKVQKNEGHLQRAEESLAKAKALEQERQVRVQTLREKQQEQRTKQEKEKEKEEDESLEEMNQRMMEFMKQGLLE